MKSSIGPVIEVVHEKCVNCHACISVCPVKYCIDGTGDTVSVRPELCIGCGSCIAACTHGARQGMDDFDNFMIGLKRGEKMFAIVAPAVAAHYEEERLHFNGWLRSIGIAPIFDVAFGAELTVESYLRHIAAKKPPLVIAQPCPAIVTYIETYQPQLLPYLAPADSPMLHVLKMIRKERPDLSRHKIVIISPCVAKRREFDETGVGDYNVTLARLARYFDENKIDLRSFPEADFDGPPSERAVLFSSPGGLKATIDRELPGLGDKVKKMEGPDIIYPYLRELPESIKRGVNPLVLDCLSCEKGCNGGTGTGSQHIPVDILESAVRRRDERHRAALSGRLRRSSAKAIRKHVRAHWKPDLFARSYVDRSASLKIRMPNEEELSAIYAKMLKTQEKDFLNCSACGYGRCEEMAIAIFNDLNKPENCQHYRQLVIEQSRSTLADMSVSLDGEIIASTKLLNEVINLLPDLSRLTEEQSNSLDVSTKRIEGLLSLLNQSSGMSTLRRSELSTLLDMAGTVKDELSTSLSAVRALSDQMRGVKGTVDEIDDIASSTNILSVNAAIQASHAGAAGRGFAVVAGEIRKLAIQASSSALQIDKTLTAMTQGIESTTATTERSGASIRSVLENIASGASGMNEILDSLGAMASETGGIASALQALRTASAGLSDTYRRMEEYLKSAADDIGTMATISHDNVRRIQMT